MKRLLETALALPATDRAVIVESLLASLDQPDAIIDERWAAEAERRLTAFETGQMKAISAAAVFEEFDCL